MNRFLTILKGLFPSAKSLAASLILGLSFALSIYLGLLQRHFFSYRYLLYGLMILVAGTVFTAWITKRFLRPAFSQYPRNVRMFLVLAALVLGLLLLFNTKPQPLYYALPDSRLEIRMTVPELPAGEEGVRLLWVETGQGFVHYSRMQINGRWERVFDYTIIAPNQTVNIIWEGKVGQQTEIAFRQTDFDQPVEVIWNGKFQIINLYQPRTPNVLIQTPIAIPFFFFLPFTISFILSVGYGMFVLLILLGRWAIPVQKKKNAWFWLLYMLPMLAAWGFALIIFWPGVMSTDALSQWGMAVTGDYNDWQSAFHALVLAGLMRIWYEPAFITGVQMFFLALSAAWGLSALDEQGIPRVYLWIISLVFALLPVNMMMAVTLWKDIAYAIAFLWLTGAVAHIALTNGDWLKKSSSWAALILAAFLTAVFRQNGAAVALLTLLILPLVFRKFWKPLTGCLAVAILLFAFTKGPLYSAIGLDRGTTGQSNLIYLHHIAAHLNANTPINQADLDYLDSFQPLEEWDYLCCYVGTISFDNHFNRSAFLANTERNRNLALRLFLKDPWVDIGHATCAAELAWKFENNQCYMKSTHGIYTWRPGAVAWIGKNAYDLEDGSLIPNLVDPVVSVLRYFGFTDDMLVFFLRPAFWLYLGVFGTLVAVIRRRDFSLLAALIPALSQTLVLFLVSFAPAFRYHYGTLLAGILLSGLLFLPQKAKP